MYLGDFAVGVTLDHFFTTRRFTTGAPFTLAGTPVISAYEDNGTTEITAGITLTVDFDSRTGLNHVRVVATGGNGFEAGKSYYLVITTGTVDSVSVVGEVIGSFTLERAPDSAGTTTLLSRLTSTRAGYLDNLSVGAVATASALSSVASDVTTLLSRIPSALFSGITSLAQWLGLIAGKQTGNSTARTELRATGAGSGTFDETTDSLEAVRDNVGTAGAGLSAAPDTAGTTTLLSRLTALRAGYLDNLSAGAVATAAKLLSYFQSALRKDVTVDADIGGNYDDATDSQEAIRDRGDAAWTTATGFSTHSAADVWAVATRELTGFSAAFKTGYALSSAGVQAIWDALTSALTTVGSIGKLLVDNINATISSRSSHTAAQAATAVRTELGTELGRIDVATSTRLAASSYTAPLDAAGTRSAVGLASANLDTQLAALAAFVDTEVALILTRLGVPASDIATLLASVKAKTDSLTFTVAGHVDSNLQRVNDVALTGDGSSGTPWGPA